MNLVRKTRTPGLGLLQDQMNDLFSRFFEDWPMSTAGREGWMPIDVAEQDDQFTVKAELPGLKNDEIDISVQDNTLVISGEKKFEREDEKDNYYHVERRYGSFRRAVSLPASVDANKVEASYRDGVLSITLPKSEQSKAKRITVK
jgi:HSP20 family protein